MVRSQRHALTDGQTLTLDLRRARFPLRYSVSGESPLEVGKDVTVSRTFDWPASPPDWVEYATLTSVRTQTIDAPLAGLRFVNAGGPATVRLNYHGAIASTVT